MPASICPPGQKVELRLDSKLVRVYHRGKLIEVHERQPKGGRSTDPDDYRAELTAYTMKAPDRIKDDAARLGPAVAEFAHRFFRPPAALVQDQAGTQATSPVGALHR